MMRVSRVIGTVAMLLVVLALCGMLQQGRAPGMALARKADPNDCEVCVAVLEEIDARLPSNKKRKKAAIEEAIASYCAEGEEAETFSPRHQKMCYYFEPIKRSVAQPFSTGMPKLKVCQRLRAENPEICEVKFPPKVEKGVTDYSKMRVKQLKAVLADRGAKCVGCIEKEDYVRRCQETEDLEL